MKGHMLHVRRKMKENNGKLKKLEASLIKRPMRISSQLFVIFSLVLSLYSLSHTLAHLDFSWSTLELDQGKQRKDN